MYTVRLLYVNCRFTVRQLYALTKWTLRYIAPCPHRGRSAVLLQDALGDVLPGGTHDAHAPDHGMCPYILPAGGATTISFTLRRHRSNFVKID